MYITLIICLSIVAIVFISDGYEKVSSYKMKKLEEEHKTANLALAYQILSTRPEMTLDDVKLLIETSNGQHLDRK